jgi:hypothetical protein
MVFGGVFDGLMIVGIGRGDVMMVERKELGVIATHLRYSSRGWGAIGTSG